jgi:putative transcriptional regulator
MATERYGSICVEVPDFTSDDIKKLRAGLGLSQYEFAVRYGIPIYSIQAWEAGKRRPNVSRRMALQKIADEQEVPNTAVS